MDFHAFQQAVAAEAAAQGIADYELYYQVTESTSVSTFRQEINEFSDSNEGGVCLRCLIHGHMGYASTEQLSQSAAQALVRRAADNAAVLETSEPEFLVAGGQSYQTLERPARQLPAADALIHAALEGQKALYAQPGVVDGCGTQLEAAHTRIAISNSHGLELAYENTVTVAFSEAIVEGDGEKTNDYAFTAAPLEELDLADMAARAADNARSKLGAGVAPTGAMPVVFAPRAMAQLLGTYAGVFSAENAQKGLSLLKDREGDTIASAAVTLVDDPFYACSAMPIPFDAEGTPSYRKNVIENGRLNTLLYNLRTAAAAGKATTGNAAKAGYDGKVTVRPFTLYLAPGSCREEELLQTAQNGVYITELGGLHAGANVISGDFSLQSAGFLIENGSKGAPVRSFTVAGNFFDLLKGIEAVADRPEPPFSTGITAYVSPSVLVRGLTIAGK